MNRYICFSILSITVSLYAMQESKLENPSSPIIGRNTPALKEKRKGEKIDLGQKVAELTDLIIELNRVNKTLHEKMIGHDNKVESYDDKLKAMQVKIDSLSTDIEAIKNHKIIDLSGCDPKKLLQENHKPIVISLVILVVARLLGW